jgi:mannose-6-phosphate isomerase
VFFGGSILVTFMIHKHKENRPWGHFEVFTKDVFSTVKIVVINRGESLSLQYHKLRQEFWRIIQGNPTVIIGGKKVSAGIDDEFFVDKHVEHRIAADKDTVVFLEISLGHFDEDDIVRLEDRYGRIPKASKKRRRSRPV